ncbi:MAG: hypothetical protein WAM91_08190 [Candidatus Acidiferrales bacterium]
MQFSPEEIRFLLAGHVERAATTARPILREAVDLREIGCPDVIFNSVLEQRARKLGRKFVEFRAAHSATAIPGELALEDRISAAKLF